MNEWMTTRQAAEHLGYQSPQALHVLVHRGQLRADGRRGLSVAPSSS